MKIEINQKYKVTTKLSRHFNKQIIITRKADSNSIYDFYYILVDQPNTEYPFAMNSIFSDSLKTII